MKSIEQQVADKLRSMCVTPYTGVSCNRNHEQEAAALSRAGLLVSERDVLCRKLAEPLAKANHSPKQGGAWIHTASGRCTVTFVDNTAALAFHDAISHLCAYDREHAPKPRYYVEAFPAGPDTHRVIDRTRGVGNVRGFGTEAECIAMNAALNALAEERRAKPEHRSEKEAGR